MSTAPTSYSEALATKNELVAEMQAISVAVSTAIARINAASVKLGQLAQAAPVGYIDLINYVNAQVTANPADADWLREQAELGKIVNDFVTKTNYLNALIAAIDAV